jgi:hypothetical protein
VLKPAIDTGGRMGRMVLTGLGMVAEMEQLEDARLHHALVRFSIVVDWRRVPTFTALVPIGLAQPGRNRSGAIIAQNA